MARDVHIRDDHDVHDGSAAGSDVHDGHSDEARGDVHDVAHDGSCDVHDDRDVHTLMIAMCETHEKEKEVIHTHHDHNGAAHDGSGAGSGHDALLQCTHDVHNRDVRDGHRDGRNDVAHGGVHDDSDAVLKQNNLLFRFRMMTAKGYHDVDDDI